jgi:hypothetical protein
MQRTRPAYTGFAFLMLGISLLCFANAYFALVHTNAANPPAILDLFGTAVRPGILLTAGIGSILATLHFWSGGRGTPAGQEAPNPKSQFGRNARIVGGEKAGRRTAAFIMAFLAIGAVAVNYLTLYGPSLPDAVVEEKPAVEDAVVALPHPQESEIKTTPAQPEEKPNAQQLPTAQDAGAVEKQSEPDDIAALPVPAIVPETVVKLPKPEPMPTQPQGHRGSVVWLALAPDGRSIMSASIDHTIKLWGVDGTLIRDLGAHKDMVRTALFLPDGTSVLSAGDDGEIVLRSLPDGKILHVFSATEHGGANKVAISSDGRRAVSGHQAGTVIVWDLEKRAMLHVLNGDDWSISSVAVSPDGGLALSGNIDGELTLWDIDQGRLVRRWKGHERGTYGMAFTADGRKMVTGSGDGTIKLWDVATAKEIRRFEGHSGTVYTLALSADGTRILSGSLDGTARLWDLATGNEIAQFNGRGSVYSVAFGTEGTILTGGEDGAIRIWPDSGKKAPIVIAAAPQQ